jgi:hypothetical protein
MTPSERENLPREGILGRRGGEFVGTASLLALIAVLWLATRPYYGIVQDARFYIIPAIRDLHPAAFADDLYFRFGATDKFTIFAKVFAPLLALFGLANAALAFTLAGQLLWVAGLVYFASGLLRDRWLALLSVAAAIALPSGYSHYGYGEPFVTPRLFAEALTLMALGLLLRRRTAWSLALLVLAAAIHPIMALAGLGVALIYLALGRPVCWLAIAAGALGAAGLTAAGVPPLANLRITFDPAWFEIASARVSEIIIAAWSAEDCWRVIGAVALAIMAFAVGGPQERRLLGAALAVALAALVATFVGADLAHNVFITQILPWRSLWLLTLLAHLYAVPIVVWLHRQDSAFDLTRTAFLTALGSLLVSRLIPPLALVASPMMAVAVALALWQHATGRQLAALARFGARLAITATGAATLLFAYQFVVVMRSLPEELGHRVFSFAVVLAALAVAIAQAMPIGRQRFGSGRWLPWLAVALIPLALVGWDVRTAWTRLVESPDPIPPSLAALLPENRLVYWEGGVEMLWFHLRRPSYFSCAQGTGAVFFRDLAVEFRRRAEVFRRLGTHDFDEPECRVSEKQDKRDPTRADLQQVCGGEPGLDYVVLTRQIAGADAASWVSPAPLTWIGTVDGKATIARADRFYVHSCAAMR